MAKGAASKRRLPSGSGRQLALGRSLSDFIPLKPAEKQLLKQCARGETAAIGGGRQPTERTGTNEIRPGFIRFLALGGDDHAPVHEKGILVEGAWISGSIELRASHILTPLWIDSCRIDGDINIRRASLPLISLRGSKIGKLDGDGADVNGDVFLDSEFEATRTVQLVGAQIGGDLYCDGSRFKRQIDDLDLAELDALSVEGAVIKGMLYFRNVADVDGSISLRRAQVDCVVDDIESWRRADALHLDGFKYARIADGPTDAPLRQSWLRLQDADDLGKDFKPQPWEQLIRVLRDMGHADDARELAIAKQDAIRAAGKFTGIKAVLHWLYWLLAGYGYQPMRTFIAMLLVLLLGAEIYDYSGQRGWMAPTATGLLSNPTIAENCSKATGMRLSTWTICASLPREYPSFSPLIYSLDLILPTVNLQQESNWVPISAKEETDSWIPWRLAVRWFMWFEILFGWAMSLLLVAVLGNLVKKD